LFTLSIYGAANQKRIKRPVRRGWVKAL